MHFIEERFPDDIAYGSAGGPEYFTNVVTASNGCEQRNIKWSYARRKYNIAPGIKDKEQMQQIVSFFHICKGRALGFRFKDWSDYYALNEELDVVNGAADTFQLIKRYKLGENLSEKRAIQKPVIDSVKIYVNGAVEEKVKINCMNGRVIFDNAPSSGAIITADFHFDVPVRFDIDYLSMAIEGSDIYSFNTIPLVEVRN